MPDTLALQTRSPAPAVPSHFEYTHRFGLRGLQNPGIFESLNVITDLLGWPHDNPD
jgi:hypothetical protein